MLALRVGMVALLAGTQPVLAQVQVSDTSPIDYVYPDQSVWTTRVNAGGEPENPLLGLAAAIFARVGLAWRAKSYPAARMFEALKEGSGGFSILVEAPVLRQCCLSSQRPVAGTEVRLYRLDGTPPIAGRDDLSGKDVITIRGYSYGQLRNFVDDPAHRIIDNIANSHEAAFLMLRNHRAAYLIDYVGPAVEVLADHPIEGLRFQVLERLGVHLVLSKTYPDAERVMARLEAAAAAILADPKAAGVSLPTVGGEVSR